MSIIPLGELFTYNNIFILRILNLYDDDIIQLKKSVYPVIIHTTGQYYENLLAVYYYSNAANNSTNAQGKLNKKLMDKYMDQSTFKLLMKCAWNQSIGSYDIRVVLSAWISVAIVDIA